MEMIGLYWNFHFDMIDDSVGGNIYKMSTDLRKKC